MLYRVLKAFPLSLDGINARNLEPDEVVAVPDRLAVGLVREGYIEPAGNRETKVIEAAPETGEVVPLAEEDPAAPEPAAESEADAVDIPADWAAMHWTKRVKLAAALGADPVTTDEANAVIEAAVAKRAE